MKIKVLGTGCKSCNELYEDVKSVLSEHNVESDIEHITDITKMIELGIMSAPALVINDEVVSTGALSKKEIEKILKLKD